MNKVLEFKNISRKFSLNDETLSVLREVNFSIHEKEKIALIGPSGAGKTSFLHIAGLLELPTSGEVYINNNLIDWNSDKILSQHRLNDIGFIFQFNNLLDDFNATENTAIPFILSGNSKKLSIEKAEFLLSEVGLGKRLKSYPNQLSGGEQQRVAIARSLINDPKIIFRMSANSLIMLSDSVGQTTNLGYQNASKESKEHAHTKILVYGCLEAFQNGCQKFVMTSSKIYRKFK